MKKSNSIKNIIPFIFLFSIATFSQNSNFYEIDSSYQYLSEKYYEYKTIDSLKAKIYADTFLYKAKNEKDTIKIIDGYFFLSDILKKDSIYLDYLDELISKTEKKPTDIFPTYAYMNKGWLFIKERENNKSLKNYLSALKFSDKNDSLKFIIKQRIGLLKIKNKQLLEGKNLFLESYNYYSQNKQKIDINNYFSLLENLTSIYVRTKIYDSALYYNKKSMDYAIKNNDTVFMGYSYFKLGQIKYKQKKLKFAIQSFKKVIPIMIYSEDYPKLFSIYNYIGKSYSKLNQPEKALIYYLKVDSLYLKNNITLPSQRNSYNFLIDYYRRKKDLKNELKYIKKLIKVDSILNSRSKNLANTFTKEYDIPKLKKEKEAAINQIKKRSQKILYYSIGFSLIIIFILIYQVRKRLILKKRFDNFMNSKKGKLKSIESPKKQELIIPQEIIENILLGLKKFEKKKGFTNRNITLNGFAIKLKTNPNYLSKVINHYKHKNFSSYLRDLRIEYAIEILEKNEQMRKYTIKAIAKEVGFNNAESFANAFNKKTGFRPSYYIKELNKRKTA